jgi:hypothetical protein
MLPCKMRPSDLRKVILELRERKRLIDEAIAKFEAIQASQAVTDTAINRGREPAR